MNIPINSATIAAKLPRISYIGEVPVEFSYHGSALLARLLEIYPPDSLQLIEGGIQSVATRRIPCAEYLQRPMPLIRLRTTRANRWAFFAQAKAADALAYVILGSVQSFRPEAILTVAHGTYWLVAERVADLMGLPLHLIVHDHPPSTVPAGPRFKRWLEARFASGYRKSASRLCVSPYMESLYADSYGVRGEVLYPSRTRDGGSQNSPPERVRAARDSLTGVFAGTINSDGITEILVKLADALAYVGGRLLVYGPVSSEQASRVGLSRPNLEVRGLISPGDLTMVCRREGDFLFAPMSFKPDERNAVMTSFPSKLAHYTEIGLPIVIAGPGYSSAVRWARENVGSALIVESEQANELRRAVELLVSPETRWELVSAALRYGHQYFAHESVHSVFCTALATGRRSL